MMNPLSFGQGMYGMSPMGFGGMRGGFDPTQMMMQMMQMMMGMMQQMMGGGGMGMPGMGMPGMGMPGMGMPGMGMPGMGMPGMGMPGMGQGMGQGGAPVELQKGSSYTTPGGSTISWKGDEVKIQEKGGGAQSMGGAGQAGGGMGMGMMMGMMGMGGGTGMGMMGMMMMGGGMGQMASGVGQQNQQRDWKVWGDPHKTNPDGSKSEDFTRNNGMFTLQDGSRVAMMADGPKGTVNKVLIFPPGAQLGGFDANKTTNYTDNNRDGKWDNNNNQTVAQAMQQQLGGALFPGF